MPKDQPNQQRQANILETPPHSVEAERTVLGAFLLDPDVAVQRSSTLTPEDFYDPTYRIIFEGIQACIADHGTVDFVMLADKLNDVKKIHDVGGSAFLAGLASAVPTSSHTGIYIKILKKKHAERATIDIGRKIQALGNTDGAASTIPNILLDESRKISELLPRDTAMNREQITEEIVNPGKKLATGFLTMDLILGGGLGAGDLMLIAARPSVGKSSLATSLTANFLARGVRPCFISLEMSRPQIVTRILSSHYKLKSNDVKKDAAKLIDELPGELDLIFGTNDLGQIQTSALSSDAQVFIIDYFGLVTMQSKENRFQVMDEISRAIKLLAVHTGKPIIMLTQLNREIEKANTNREPRLSDLWGGGEKDADIISFLWDPNAKALDGDKNEMDRKTSQTAAEFEGKSAAGGYEVKSRVFGSEVKDIMWLVRKNRNGPCGDVALAFDPARCLLTEKPGNAPAPTQGDLPF